MLANSLFLLIGVVLVAGMPSSSPKPGVESTTIKILVPPPSSSFDDEDDAVIIDASDTSPPVDPTPLNFSSSVDCFHLPEKGPCKAIIESWTYSHASRSCVSFQWSGCGGNANRFPELEYCDRHCTRALNNSSNSTRLEKSEKCPKFEGCGPLKCAVGLDADTGCQKCECNLGAGILGSVSGNPEDPNQQKHVKSEKKAVTKPEDVCHLPETRGNCRAMMTRWRYSPELKECVQFHFGGCESEKFANNFHSKEKCAEFCQGQ